MDSQYLQEELSEAMSEVEGLETDESSRTLQRTGNGNG